MQKRACTPVPLVLDDDEFNARLLAFCKSEMNRTVSGQQVGPSGQSQTIGERFEIDKREAIELPKHRFDP